MNFAHIKHNAVISFMMELPYTFNGVARFRTLTSEQQAAHGIVPVVNVTGPYDPAAFRTGHIATINIFADRVEITKELIALPPLSEQELAKKAREDQDEAERLLLKGNAQFIAFINMTPTQIDNWVSANVNNLAEAKTALALLAKFVNIAIRRHIRD